MSKEKRQQVDFLEEIDEFFQEKGLSESIEKFLGTDEAVSTIDKVTDIIIENTESVKLSEKDNKLNDIVNRIRSGLEKDKTALNNYIIALFKVSLAYTINMVLQFTDDTDEQEYFLTTIKESMTEKGVEDIQGICTQLF